ncbi:MAG TPA: hypothetical protein PLX97_13665, partial [Gemmatales bacterium]|nr:hypothetical protein [Gemmatales bacterium]
RGSGHHRRGGKEVRITCDSSSRVVVLRREAITDNDDLYAVSSIDGAASSFGSSFLASLSGVVPGCG